MDDIAEMAARDTGEREFKPVYIAEGDCVVYYADDTPCHAIRLDDVATVYVSDSDPTHLVGVQIKGVVKRIRRYGAFAVEITKEGVAKLGMLFMMAGVAPDDSPLARGFFESDLATRDVEIPELCAGP